VKKVYLRNLFRYYSFYTGGFVLFLFTLAVAEFMGMPEQWIGWVFMAATISLYAGIGIMSRTSDVDEYYVAGRRVPAVYNGMATGADWMSAASFIGMAGTLYAKGYDGLAFVLGWTGGYVLVALLLAPYLRKFGQFTIPDFIGARYGGNLARSIAVLGAILASFTYVTAQIYGVGIVTSRFLGIAFETGVFVGLAGILVCSFLGGMRAVTWTQVAQYIILIIAYLVPVVFMSYKVTSVPLPQLVYGSVMQELEERERVLMADPAQEQARRAYAARADMLEQRLRDQPDAASAQREQWHRAMKAAQEKAQPLHPHAEAFPGADAAQRDEARRNFLALAFCLMVGTAALPHVLMRYYTTPSVREARESVFWSLFFIFLLYFTAPAYAVFAKYEVYTNVIGTAIAELPDWVASWTKVGLVAVEDINRRRHPATGGAHPQPGRDRAGHAGDRRPALRGGRPGGGRRPGGGPVHRRRPAADHRQRPVPRRLFPDDQSQRHHHPPPGDLQVGAAGRGGGGGLGGLPAAGHHPVHGGLGLFHRRLLLLPGPGAGHLLAPGDAPGRRGGHADGPGADPVLPGRREVHGHGEMVGHRRCLRRRVRHSRRVSRHCRGEPVHLDARQDHPRSGGTDPLPGPFRRRQGPAP
jgi:probable sodium:solute symporter